MTNSDFTLGKAQVGDKFKFSQRGTVWTVIAKWKESPVHQIIRIRSKKGTIKTCHNRQVAWNNPVIYT